MWVSIIIIIFAQKNMSMTFEKFIDDEGFIEYVNTLYMEVYYERDY